MSKSGLSPQFIMRASLARHIVEISKPDDGGNTPHWQKPEYQKRSGESEIENLTWYSDYAERGYTAGERGVLAANWNYFTRNVTDLLERAGFDTQWSDEWTACEECGKAVRTSGDCWDWQPYYVMIGECSIVCLDCVDWKEYLEQCEDNPRVAVMRACNPAEYGYLRLSDPAEYENGFHPGQNDEPEAILEKLQSEGYKGIVFRIPETSQFYITFETWMKAPSIDGVRDYLETLQYRAEDRYKATSVDSPNCSKAYRETQDLKDALTLVRFAEVR